MPRFMFAFTWKEAPNPALAEAEREQVRKLIATGQMEQVLLAADRSRGWLVFNTDSIEAARAAASTLPFHPAMHLEETRLENVYPE